jgi:hypothetical protein
MGTTERQSTNGVWERQNALIATNIAWLNQALEVLERIDDRAYATSPQGLEPHRAGGHLRHVLEFYECFLDDVATAHVDYDARRRDVSVEKSRRKAAARIRGIISRLQSECALGSDSILWVRMEDAKVSGLRESFITSSVGRELQVLSSHTIHHFALIAITLRAHGVTLDRNFGMAPSTLTYLSTKDAA